MSLTLDTTTLSNIQSQTSPAQPSSANHTVPEVLIQPSASSENLTAPLHSTPPKSVQKAYRNSPGQDGDDATWGSNFWVTLVDPQTQTSFFACPATGQVSWDPPIGNFVLPPSEEGEWWELTDDSRGGIPYYYQTKTGETVWERPAGFVIPLGIIQNTALGRRLSRTTFDRFSKVITDETSQTATKNANASVKQTKPEKPPPVRRSVSYASDQDTGKESLHPNQTNRPATGGISQKRSRRRSISAEQTSGTTHPHPGALSPIPGSPYSTDHSSPPTPSSARSKQSVNQEALPKDKESPNNKPRPVQTPTRSQSSPTPHRAQLPQSLQAAAEILSSSQSESGHASLQNSLISSSSSSSQAYIRGHLTVDIHPGTLGKHKDIRNVPPSPQRPIPATPNGRRAAPPTVGGKGISEPVLNSAARLQMSPVKNRSAGQPIPVQPTVRMNGAASITTLNTNYPTLPLALASDIQQFSESEYARQYFSTHRSGFIFKRRVPLEQLMTWQKGPLTSPLLMLNRTLHKDAVKVFKVIQHIMGDRDRERHAVIRIQPDNNSTSPVTNASSTSLVNNFVGILEEQRWLLGEGLTHGELRDEIYCQLMKQLTGNGNTESVFKGWQLLCVLLITFPPSKNFETYLQAFIQRHTTQQEGRVDVMAKSCLRRLVMISKKGPRGKPPTIAEIETAADAAFNPSTFGESLDAIIRLQERNYPHQKVPIILPFLADGILALGGPKSEGIFRVPGDNDSVSELKLRIDRGYYTLDGVDDPHVLASLFKLWLRELCDPLVPEEMYNECVMNSKNPEACVRIVERLPTINRRVVLFVISFLQLFLEERTQKVTKMTPANLALVMAPNLLRCSSELMSVVFTNAQYEQIFVYNLLLHLRCDEVDNSYKPTHGLGALQTVPAPRTSKQRSRRQNQ